MATTLWISVTIPPFEAMRPMLEAHAKAAWPHVNGVQLQRAFKRAYRVTIRRIVRRNRARRAGEG